MERSKSFVDACDTCAAVGGRQGGNHRGCAVTTRRRSVGFVSFIEEMKIDGIRDGDERRSWMKVCNGEACVCARDN